MSNEPVSDELNAIPEFADEAEEQAFWENHDAVDYMHWTDAKNVVLPTSEPETEIVSLELSSQLVNAIKAAADSRNMPYHTLIEAWLQEKTGDFQ